MKPQDKRQTLTSVSVNLRAIQHNVREMLRVTAGLPLMAVVKANAYGHGATEVAKKALTAGCTALAVVSVEEALALRKNRIRAPILVLSYVSFAVSRDLLSRAIENNIELVVYDAETAYLLSALGQRLKKRVRLHVKVDSGTTRVGVFPKTFFAFYDLLKRLPRIQISGVFTHFAEAEKRSSKRTQQQVRTLASIQRQLKKTEKKLPMFHAACSAALLTNKASWFNAGRLGIMLYGLWPSEDLRASFAKKVQLVPALSWHTKILQVKEVPKGTQISYDGTYTTRRHTKIGVLPVGYADGFPRSLSNTGQVLVDGKFAPIRGRVCMNLTMIDVTNIPAAHVGSRVTLIGRDGKREITAEDVGKLCNTINYEIVTRINWLIPRFYTNRK